MDRMHIRRLLTICLSIMLSVSMLPAGAFAAGDPAQDGSVLTETGINNNYESTDADDSNQKDAVKAETGETSGSDDVNQGDDDQASGNNNTNQDNDMAGNTANDPADKTDTAEPGENDDVDEALTKGEAVKAPADTTSFSVTFDDVSLPMDETHSIRADKTVSMEIFANMSSTEGEKKITIDIPTGWALMGCSLRDSDTLPTIELKTNQILGPLVGKQIVEHIKIDPIYQEQVKSVTLEPATDSEYGTVTGDTWESQVLEGYEGKVHARTLGGKLTYTLDGNAQNMRLFVHLHPQPYIFSRDGTVTEEVMPPVTATLSVKTNGSDDAEIKSLSTEDKVIATNIPRLKATAQTPTKYNDIVPTDSDKVHFYIQGGISQWNGNTQNSTWISFADEFKYTIEYPAGVFYSEEQTGINLQGSDWPGKYPGTIEIDEDPVNGGGTITITGNNIELQHNNTEYVLYFDAKAYNPDVNSFKPDCNKVWAADESPETLTVTASAEFKRLGTTTTTTAKDLKWQRTIFRPATGDAYAIKIGDVSIVRRDLTDDFGLDQYDIKLAHTSLESAFVYEDVPFHFENKEKKLGITGFRMAGKDIKDIKVKTFYADGREGREISLDGPYGATFPASDTNASYMVSGNMLGLEPGEYIYDVNLRADIGQRLYGVGNLGCGIGFMGQFLQDRSDEEKAGTVDISIVHYNDGEYDNTVAKSTETDPLTGENKDAKGSASVSVGMDIIGSGSCVTTLSKSQDATSTLDTWYPNEVIYFKSTLNSSWVIHQQDTIIDPVITIALPEGLLLNDDSVMGQSAAGTKDGWFKLDRYGEKREITDAQGYKWNCYDFKASDPLEMVAAEQATNYVKTGGTVTDSEMQMSVRFNAYVASDCHPYTLDAKDCVLWYIGDKVENGNGGTSCVHKDVDNRMGRGPEIMAAHGSRPFFIKPLIGLVTDLAIRADESPDADWMTWAGGDNTVANVHEGKPAQIKFSYESTADSEDFNNSVFYLPIPKKGAGYDYVNNVELASPNDATDFRKFGFTANLTGPIKMESEDTNWTTYYAVSAKSAESSYDAADPDADKWEPVSPVDPDTWLTEADTADWTADDWAKVVMVKFKADDPIPPGKKGQALFTVDIDPDAEFGTYDYWRSYGAARLGNQASQWMYTPVLAATPTSATLLGQIFVDDDVNAAFDEDSGEQGYGENFTAVLSKDDGSIAPMSVTVENDGSMKLLDEKGRQIYLRMGDYTLTVTNTDEDSVYDYEQIESDTPSSESKWYNDIKNANISGAVATHSFTVDKSVEKTRSRAAGNIKPVVYYAGVGLAQLNDFSFTKLGENDNGALEALAGAKFALYTDADCTVPAERDGTAYEAMSGADGKVEFNEIVAGTYYMKETELLAGTEDKYFNNTTTYRVVVSNDAKVEITRTVADPNTGDTTKDDNGDYSINNRQKTSFTGIKIWNDGGAENHPSITVSIIADGAETAAKIVEVIFGGEAGEGQVLATETDDGWTFTVDGLNKFKDGEEIDYSVTEEAVDGYLTSYDGNTITNTEKTESTVKKVWNDGDNAEGTRPESLEFSLFKKVGDGAETAVTNADGQAVTKTLPVSGKWEATVQDLPKYDSDGNEITYSWKEPESIDNYALTDTEVEGTVTTFTNTLMKEISVEKKWVGPETKTNPEKVTVNLLRGETKIDSAELSASNTWKHTFTSNTDYVLYAYDEQGQAIDYSITEDEVTGYKVKVSGPETTGNTDEYTVTNTYEAEGTLALGGLKKLDVESGKLTAGQFTFTVKEGDKVLATGTNDAAGKITFDPATVTYKYDKDNDDLDDHELVISETKVEGRVNGAATDAEDVTVTVNVTDKGDGTLTVTPADITESVEMTNSYEATGYVTFSGKKSISHGRRIEEGEVFTFTVKEGEKTVATGESDAEGNITFTKISYTLNKDVDETGTHIYTVTEDAYDSKGVTNSEESYTVTVEVSDKGNGELEVTPSENFSGLDFENPYEAEGETTIEAEKVLENREFKEGDAWTFTISGENGAPLPVDEEGNEISSVTIEPSEGNTAAIDFGTFKYDLGDLDNKAYESKTFTYTITESGEIEGVRNDEDTDRELKVKVTDDGTGELKVETAEDSEEVKFVNTYETEGEVTFSGFKTLKGATIKAGQFSFELYDEDGKLLETVSNEADGSYSFTTLSYTGDDLDRDEDGNYMDTTKEYRVVEKEGAAPHITYDDTEYNITAELSDDKQGTINVTADPEADSYDFTNTYTPDKLHKGVNTGDDNNLMGWIALMLLAGAGIGSTAFFHRRRRDNE